ncbi:2-nitropropane dioxygenase precursor [Dethiosulfovibrio peptidovorans DSM 11002]|uniref:2-nitropropane dioxygenase n=1 Tax=Dethiosulfovibrio peptidovorans DSM 11002 TaxID=469381 RepID=D2Z475_9BACT|nr:2-nitropropane dioxygenase precursor [Dethiosulfovibrio peptidovorans DSM 11002]
MTGRPTGHPVRCIRNKLTSQFDHMEISGASVEDIEALGAGKLRAAVVDGDVDFGSVMAGQIAAMVSRIQPASEIIEEICREAEEVLSRLGSVK